MRNSKAQGIKLFGSEFKVFGIELFSELSSAHPMLRISAIVLAATVVQKTKELNNQEIGLADLANLAAVIEHTSPMVCSMNAVPVQTKLVFEVLHQLRSFIVHRLALAVYEYGDVVLI